MTTNDYLDIRGFDKNDWTVLSPTASAPLLTVEGFMNNMFKVTESKAIKVFGKNSYVVKKEWAAKHMLDDDEDEVETITEAKTATIPAPPIPAEPIKDVTKEVEDSPLLKARKAQLIVKGWKINDVALEKDGEVIFFPALENMSNEEWDNYIIVKPTEEEGKSFIKEDNDLPNDFECEQEKNTGNSCDTQCKFCKPKADDVSKNKEYNDTQQSRIDLMISEGFIHNKVEKQFTLGGIGIGEAFVFNSSNESLLKSIDQISKNPNKEAKKEIEKIAETVGAPKDNIIIASVPKPEHIVEETPVAPEPIETPKEVVEEVKPVKAPKEKVVKEVAEKVTPLPTTKEPLKNIAVAPEKLGIDLALIDNIASALNSFQKTSYILIQIKDIISYDDIDNDEKYEKIVNLINDL